jgi:hypothetical protein
VVGVLCVSGVLGFHLGAVTVPDWQVPVETAQVVAGLVDYPAGNPFYIYHTKLWTVLHQVLALCLTAGVSERTLSIAVAGLVGMVSFQGLSLLVYALSRDLPVAVAAPALIYFSRVAETGAVYPIWLAGTSHTYGVLGLGYLVLVVALLGVGWQRSGLALLGAAPAIHPSLGVWLVTIVASVWLWDLDDFRTRFRPALGALAAGAAVAAVSLLVQFTLISDVPATDRAVTAKYLAAFVTFWDMHRQPVNLNGGAVKLNIAALVVGGLWLGRFAGDLPRPARFLLRVVVVSALLSLLLALVTRVPPDRLPAPLLTMMPGRLLNLNVLIFGAIVLGLVSAYRAAVWASALALALALALLLGDRSGLWTFPGPHEWIAAALSRVGRVNTTTLLVQAAALLVGFAFVFAGQERTRQWATGLTAASLVVRGLRAALLLLLLTAVVWTWRQPPPGGFLFLDRTNDQLFRMVSERPGLLLTGGDLHLIQLRTRRPVLLDGGGLDALPYAIEAAPATERILRDVYAIDLLNPPEEARHLGALPQAFVKAAWEGYTPDRWRQIGEQYGVTDVLTSGDWTLQLPVVVRNRWFTVYDIP